MVAHPRFREELLKGIFDDPYFTKPYGAVMGKIPRGVTLYKGPIKLAEE